MTVNYAAGIMSDTEFLVISKTYLTLDLKQLGV